MKKLLWVSIAFITYSSAFADSWDDNAFVSQTDTPNLEQNMSIEALRPGELEFHNSGGFKSLGVGITKQALWMGARGSYSWPMPTENTSLGIYGDYAWNTLRNKKVSVGIESISYFGDVEQSGFFLKGCVGVGRALGKNKIRGSKANTALVNKKTSSETVRNSGKHETTGHSVLSAEMGIGYSMEINRRTLLFLSACLKSKAQMNTLNNYVAFELGVKL